MMDKGTCLRFYKQKEVQEAMVLHAQDKEVGFRYNEGFGKRPDILAYPRDVLELALQNVTSFHASEERWSNPLALSSDLNKKELEELRIGWDLVLDIDCKILAYSQICADLIIKFFKYCGVKDLSIKFSGNKGFHIGVPFEAFPQQVGGVLTKSLFPEAAKKIAFYIKENIKEELGKRILAHAGGQLNQVREQVDLSSEEIIYYQQNELGDSVAKLNVENFLEIDTVLISSRHLYRMPYSLHEKSGLVSLPFDPDKVMEFQKDMAVPNNVNSFQYPFLNRKISGESARQLLIQALDYKVKLAEPKEIEKAYQELEITCPITEEFFPPCVKLILNGLEDGKKRAIFCLMNFLGKIGWEKQAIQNYLQQWNKEKNKEPLREVYLKGQLNHFVPKAKLPPNCDNEAYCKGINVCVPDGLCRHIKNPVNYTLLRWRSHLQDNPKKDEISTETL